MENSSIKTEADKTEADKSEAGRSWEPFSKIPSNCREIGAAWTAH